MEYYVVIEGQKQGPFDILTLIKKVKNGSLTPETLVSESETAAFRPAQEFEELKAILQPANSEAGHHSTRQKIGLKEIMADGIELWSRRVIDYTVIAGIIIAIGFGISLGLRKVQVLADYPFIINYVTSVVIVLLFSFFFHYVLVTKRSHEPDMKEFAAVAQKSFLRLLTFAALYSTYTLAFEINLLTGMLALAMLTLASTFLCFVPFLIQDNELRMRDASRLSISCVRTIGSEAFGVLLTIVAINLAVAVLPAIVAKSLFVFGLFISIPITVAALAHIYDRVFA